MQYHFADVEMAKYVRKLCTLQSTFYKENIQLDAVPGSSQRQHVQVGGIDNPNHAHLQQQHQQMMNMNRNMNINSHGGGGSYIPLGMGNYNNLEQVMEGTTYFGVTPDLIAPTMSSTNAMATSTLANSTYISSSSINNTSSSMNQSGFSLNSSSASGLNINTNQNGIPGTVNVNRSHSQNYGSTGGGGAIVYPSPPSIIHQFPPPHLLQGQGSVESQPIMFHPGELYNQVGDAVMLLCLSFHKFIGNECE